MKIGIPKALLYYYYGPFWKTLFSELGCEVVISDDTNGRIISEGSKITVSEFCVPIKIFNGHVINLTEKGVDFIFIPVFYKLKNEWYCPKFLGLSDIVKYSLPEYEDKILMAFFENKKSVENEDEPYLALTEKLGVTKGEMKKALKKARACQEKFRALSEKGYTVTQAFDILSGKEAPEIKKYNINIALMGYVYNVYDNFVSMDTVKKLNEMGVGVTTFEMLPEEINAPDKKAMKEPYWVFARKVYNSALYLLDKGEIDGIIHLTAFCCGPDSVIGKLMELRSEEKKIPFMTMRVDEHTGDNHVQTRLEAFTDMIKMKKKEALV